MSSDRSRARRQLAEECLALAQQIADTNLRASLVAMAQRWLDLSEREPQKHDEAIFRALRAKIGGELRAQYELPDELPHGIITLLMQLNEPQDGESCATVANGQSGAS
jgi:hypothetical protein